MPVLDPAAIGGILADLGVSIASYAAVAAFIYSVGGILIRTISWELDQLIISYIAKFYDYFEIILKGEILSQEAISTMLNGVYLLVGVFVLFRLAMLLIRYILSPEQVNDEKAGVSKLAQRVIIGIALMIFIPTIFNTAREFQNAILNDKIIENVIMSDEQVAKVTKLTEEYGTGQILGVTVLDGFFALEEGRGTSSIRAEYKEYKGNYDPSVIGGIMTEVGDDYVYSYFPLLSTIALAYVLYLMVKYCLDVVVRSFKLVILQVISPICIVEYMINGDTNEVFKNWRKAAISTYLMLFLRIFTIWFIAYVCLSMQPGVGFGSGTLLQEDDMLLKAIIVMGLLAFLMDFPKMISELFGMDLEQDGSVKNVLGKAMKAGTVGLSIGAAAGGLAMAGGKVLSKGTHTAIGSRAKPDGAIARGRAWKKDVKEGIKSGATDLGLGKADARRVRGAAAGLGAAVLGSTSAGSAMRQGASGYTQTNRYIRDEEERASRYGGQGNSSEKSKEYDDLVEKLTKNGVQDTPDFKSQLTGTIVDLKARAQLSKIDQAGLTASLAGAINTVENKSKNGTVDMDAVVKTTSKIMKDAGFDVPKEQVQNIIQRVQQEGQPISNSASEIVQQVAVQYVNNTEGKAISQAVDKKINIENAAEKL